MQIICTSPWLPVEWIKAHGLEPRGVWSRAPGLTGALREGVCAFAQQLADLPQTCPDSAIIMTTACDQMRRAADCLPSGEGRVFLFNLPATWQTPAARRLYRCEIERLGKFLVRLGGSTPSTDQLQEVICDYGCRRERLREMLPYMSATQAAEMLLAFFETGVVPAGMPPAATLVGVPLAVVGGPLLRSQLGLFEAIESVGGRVALNATEPGERCLPPALPVAGASHRPLDQLADHYFDNAVDVFHRPNSRLYTWLRAHLVERQVRAIVLWVHVGCDLWRAEALSLNEELGLSVLVLDAHEGRGIGPRDLNRLGALVEALR